MLTPFPSASALALALGARLTLRGLTLRRNPWTFGDSVSHAVYRYSCQHSHFRYLHGRSRARFTGLRNAPLPRSEDRNQKSVIRTAATQAPQHPGDLPVLALPAFGDIASNVAKIATIHGPHLHLVGRSNRHHQEATKLGPRQSLATKTLGQIGADRFRGSPHLIGQCKLLDPREFEARPMHLQRQPVGPLKHLEILGPFD